MNSMWVSDAGLGLRSSNFVIKTSNCIGWMAVKNSVQL